MTPRIFARFLEEHITQSEYGRNEYHVIPFRRLTMVRPRHENPTPAELEVLQVIWDQGPSTVREVMKVLNQQRPRAYTSIMSLMTIMAEKGQLSQKAKGRAFVYSARISRAKAQSRMVRDLLSRVFGGSASALVTQLLEQAKPDSKELDEIRRTISEFAQKEGEPPCQS
jgi:predicted transcriptional regulator